MLSDIVLWMPHWAIPCVTLLVAYYFITLYRMFCKRSQVAERYLRHQLLWCALREQFQSAATADEARALMSRMFWLTVKKQRWHKKVLQWDRRIERFTFGYAFKWGLLEKWQEPDPAMDTDWFGSKSLKSYSNYR